MVDDAETAQTIEVAGLSDVYGDQRACGGDVKEERAERRRGDVGDENEGHGLLNVQLMGNSGTVGEFNGLVTLMGTGAGGGRNLSSVRHVSLHQNLRGGYIKSSSGNIHTAVVLPQRGLPCPSHLTMSKTCNMPLSFQFSSTMRPKTFEPETDVNESWSAVSNSCNPGARATWAMERCCMRGYFLHGERSQVV